MDCSKKLDKIDKIIISLTFIIVTMICIFNCFCYAVEDIEGVILNGLQSPNGATGELYNSNSKGFYFPVKKNHNYTIKINYEGNFDVVRVGSTTQIPSEGVYFNQFGLLHSQNKSLTFTPTKDSFMYVYMYNWEAYDVNIMTNEYIEIIDNTVGLDGVITDLFTSVGISQLWNIFDQCIPYILIVVLFSLAFWFIKHNIIENSKGRDF